MPAIARVPQGLAACRRPPLKTMKAGGIVNLLPIDMIKRQEDT
jgi:hypothetical protein